MPGEFTGPAVSKYGKGNVDAAYRSIAEFAATNAMNPKVINTPRTEVTASDLAPVERVDDSLGSEVVG